MKSLISLCMTLLVMGLAISHVSAQQVEVGVQNSSGGTQQPSAKVPDLDKCTSYNKEDYGEKNHIGDYSGYFGNWSVGSKATAAAFRYNMATEKAAFNERTVGVGLSFRYYTDSQLENADGAKSIKQVPKACRARTEDLLDFSTAKNGEKAKVGSLFSISPTIFVSKTETEGDVSIQPAIVVGFLNDILSIGTAYNLSGTGKGQWSLLIGPSYGFQW